MNKAYLFLFLSVFILSCSGDDDNGEGPGISTTDYFPLNSGNYWVYDVDGSAAQGRDSLYVSNDTVISGNDYKKFKSRDLAVGFFSGSLSNNSVRKSGSKILVSGTSSLAFAPEFPLDVEISDFVLLDENATEGQQLASVQNVIEQVFEGYDVEIDFELVSTAGQNYETYTVNGQEYQNVKAVVTTLELSITAFFEFQGFTVPATILEPQNVLTSTQYYAADIGVINVETTLQYNLTDLSQFGVELPIEQSGSETQQEILVNYSIE